MGENFEDFIEDGTEVKVEEAVGFVHDEVFEVTEGEAFGVFKVVEEAARCSDDDMRSLAQSNALRYHIHSTH